MNRVRLAWLVALVLVFSVVTLTSLCQASPPDPTWIGGLYDDADHDDVVLIVVGTVAVPAAESPQVRAPITGRKAPSAIVREAPSKRSLIARLDRAPPLA